MNILYIVQQSIYNNKGQWLSADSNPMMIMGIIDQLLEKTDWKFDVMISPIEMFADITDYRQLLVRPSERVRFIPRPGPVSAFTNRYHFDVELFTEVFKAKHYDVVINNIIELTRNIKTLLWEMKKPVKIVVGNYWIDCPMVGEEKIDLRVSYDWRQIDGAQCADLVTFTCQSTKQIFLINCAHRMNFAVSTEIGRRATIWDFGFSAYELDLYAPVPERNPLKRIVFPNRLSMINYTHHEEFIKAVNDLYEKRQDFEVVFTNPSQKVSWEWLKANVKPLKVISEKTLNREEYINLLWSSDISVSLYTNERYGGCANVEAIYCGTYPVMTNYGEYIRRARPDFQKVELDLSNLEAVLDNALNMCQKEPVEERIHRNNLVYNQSSYEKVSQTVIEDIRELVV